MKIISIDVGYTGAIGVLNTDGFHVVYDMPIKKDIKDIDFNKLVSIFVNNACVVDCNTVFLVERQHAFHKQGVKSVFSLGEQYGGIRAIIEGMNNKPIIIEPKNWIKATLQKADKTKSVELAETLFPELEFRGAKGGLKHGRSDAMLMADWWLVTTGIKLYPSLNESEYIQRRIN